MRATVKRSSSCLFEQLRLLPAQPGLPSRPAPLSSGMLFTSAGPASSLWGRGLHHHITRTSTALPAGRGPAHSLAAARPAPPHMAAQRCACVRARCQRPGLWDGAATIAQACNRCSCGGGGGGVARRARSSTAAAQRPSAPHRTVHAAPPARSAQRRCSAAAHAVAGAACIARLHGWRCCRPAPGAG